MKKLLIIICGLVLAVSCNNLEGPDGPGAQNPLNECVLPSVVQAGEEALVQWNGFSQTDRIYLVSESGQEFEVTIKVFTDSGIMFVVPASLPTGTYTLMLERNGQKELGTIEVTAADMPVTGINLPSSGIIGEEMTIEGIGFEDGCSVLLVGTDGKEYIIKAQLLTSGISIMICEEVAQGLYDLYLLQYGVVWKIASAFAVYGNNGPKILRRLEYYAPYSSEATFRYSWDINREEPASLTLSGYVIEGDVEELQAYDLYESDGNGYFELTHDGFESSNDISMSYTRSQDGTVTLTDVLIYGNNQTMEFTWSYDADGYLTDISSPTRSFRSLEYTAGNLSTFRNTTFEYVNPGLVNHPSAPDVVWAYMTLMESNDPFVYFPFMLGWYTRTSSQLPVAMITPSPTGTGTDRNEFTYTFDEEGYVIKMAWESCEIHFVY